MAAYGVTREAILEAALELFSSQGFEATSVSQLAEAVGLRKASLYSHFESKQQVLDTLLQKMTEEYNARSVFARADWDDPAFTADKEQLSAEAVTEMVLGHVRFILHDPHISKVRRLLVIEQFRNPQLAAVQTRQSYTDVLHFAGGMVGFLVRQGRLVAGDIDAMAAQFCMPVSIWIALCDREPAREAEALALIERHIRQFFAIYLCPAEEEK